MCMEVFFNIWFGNRVNISAENRMQINSIEIGSGTFFALSIICLLKDKIGNLPRKVRT